MILVLILFADRDALRYIMDDHLFLFSVFFPAQVYAKATVYLDQYCMSVEIKSTSP